MSQATIINHIPLEDLPPHVISFFSGYPPSERGHVVKKLLVYAVNKLEVCEIKMYVFSICPIPKVDLYVLRFCKSRKGRKTKIDNITSHPLGGVMRNIIKEPKKRIKSLQNY